MSFFDRKWDCSILYFEFKHKVPYQEFKHKVRAVANIPIETGFCKKTYMLNLQTPDKKQIGAIEICCFDVQFSKRIGFLGDFTKAMEMGITTFGRIRETLETFGIEASYTQEKSSNFRANEKEFSIMCLSPFKKDED